MRKVRITLTESGAKFLNIWNKNMNQEYENRFGTPYWDKKHPTPLVEAGCTETMTYDNLLMLQSGPFIAAFPQPAIIIEEIWEE